MGIETIANMSDPHEAIPLLNEIKRLRGPHRFEIKRHRPRRSDRQNRFYWPCFVHYFAEFLRDQGDYVTDYEAHSMLKHKFLRRSHVDKNTGEVMDYTPSTTSLDTAEFNEYLDRCAHWLSDMFGIIVPEPHEYHEKVEQAPNEQPQTTP